MLNLVDRATKAVEWVVVALAALGSAIIVIQMVWISYGVFMALCHGPARPDGDRGHGAAVVPRRIGRAGLCHARRFLTLA